MAYRKTYRRKFPSKRRYRRRPAKSSLGAMAIKGLGGFALKMLKSKLGLNTEKHWLDTVETNVGTSSTCSAMTNPLVIPIGDNVNTRTGNSIRMTSYVVRGRIQANTAATTATFVRVFFVTFSQVRGSNPAAAAFLDSTSRITSQYNMGDSASASGYKVLYDRTFKIEISGQTGDLAHFNFVFNPLSYHINWDSSDTTGAVASLSSNQIRGYIMTSETGANTPNYWADHRVKFVDN